MATDKGEKPDHLTIKDYLQILTVFPALGALVGQMLWEGQVFKDEPSMTHAEAVIVVAICGVFAGLWVLDTEAKARRKKAEEAAKTIASLKEADARVARDATFASVWNAAQQRLDQYHRLAWRISEQSFLHSQVAAGLGLVTAAGCAVMVLRSESMTGKVTVTLLGAVAAAMATFISKTFLQAQERASTRERAYFTQAVESWRYLSVERLIQQIEDRPRRADAVERLALEVMRRKPELDEAPSEDDSQSSPEDSGNASIVSNEGLEESSNAADADIDSGREVKPATTQRIADQGPTAVPMA